MRMGLLDDAIREHLELKRRRGADPGEVAREQREALDVEAQAAAAGRDGSEAEPALATPVAAGDSTKAGGEPADAVEGAPGQLDQTAALGETAELDMSSVLGDEQTEDADRTSPEAGGDKRAGATPTDEDSLEWEVPGEAVEAEPEAEAEEDVLEETPDFLRETPEQDRLWFEQRPPRDFDFDK
jgi:hypothetical protein